MNIRMGFKIKVKNPFKKKRSKTTYALTCVLDSAQKIEENVKFDLNTKKFKKEEQNVLFGDIFNIIQNLAINYDAYKNIMYEILNDVQQIIDDTSHNEKLNNSGNYLASERKQEEINYEEILEGSDNRNRYEFIDSDIINKYQQIATKTSRLVEDNKEMKRKIENNRETEAPNNNTSEVQKRARNRELSTATNFCHNCKTRFTPNGTSTYTYNVKIISSILT